MQLLVDKKCRIRRPALEVFQYVSNMENFGEWFPGVIAIESHNPMRHGEVGKEYLETVRVPLRGQQQIVLAVQEVRGHQFFATEGRFRPLLPRMEIALAETDGGFCELTWRMYSRSSHPAVRYLLLPLAKRVMGQRATSGLAALKERMEATVLNPASE